MENPDPWLLVFDLDGTLIDSSLDLCLSVNAAMVEVGAPELPHTRISSYIGDGAAALVRRALGDRGELHSASGPASSPNPIFDQAFNSFLRLYSKHKLDHTRAYPGVLASLQTIRRLRPELPMAVLTNKPEKPSREICDALGLGQFFFANYGGNSFSSKKPDPEGLLTLMSEARASWSARGVDPETLQPSGVVMIGDSDVDVLTARGADARSLGCRYGLAPEALAAARPDLVCDTAAEWPARLGFC